MRMLSVNVFRLKGNRHATLRGGLSFTRRIKFISKRLTSGLLRIISKSDGLYFTLPLTV